MQILLAVLCGLGILLNIALGSWFVWTFLTIDTGTASIDWTAPETLIYLFNTVLAFAVAGVCWVQRNRWPAWRLLMLAALPLVILLVLTEFKLTFRWE